MRTVSFSDSKVRTLLNKEFINTYTNTTGDPTAGKSIWHKPDDLAGHCERGVGGQNVQTIFLTPEGKIFHAATGYLSAEDLLDEARFAQDLFKQIESTSGPVAALVRRAHRERLVELGYDESQIDGALSNNPFSSIDLVKDVEPGNFFAGKTKKEILAGNAFSIKHPMMDYREFQDDPTPLVGKGKSAFVSTRADGVTPAKRSGNLDDEAGSDDEESGEVDQPTGFPSLPEGFPQVR